MPHLLQLHKIWWLKRLTLKAQKKARRKHITRIQASKIEESNHAKIRLEERFSKMDNCKVKLDLVHWILSWKIKYNEWLKTYKIYGNKWIYILGGNYKLVTVMNENLWSNADKYYLWLTKENRYTLMKELWILFE